MHRQFPSEPLPPQTARGIYVKRAFTGRASDADQPMVPRPLNVCAEYVDRTRGLYRVVPA